MVGKGLFAGILLSVVIVACGDSTAAQGESCYGTDSRTECDPGLVCVATRGNESNLTCQSECSKNGSTELGCKPGDRCVESPTKNGTFSCQAP